MSDLDNVVELVEFSPSPAMRQAKAKFWVRYNEMPLADESTINSTLAQQLSGNTTVGKWWKQPGFKEWFTNSKEWVQRIEYLALLSLDAAEEVLLDPQAPAAAKVNLIKAINELANKLPSKSKEIKFIDGAVADMDEKQLSEFIKRNTKLLKA